MNGDLHLVARVADRLVAVAATQVASVSELEKTTSVPGAPAWIEGIGTQRSRALTIIDACLAIGAPDSDSLGDRSNDPRCIVFTHNDHHYALRCDAILDVVPVDGAIGDVSVGLGPEWLSAVNGVAETSFGPALLLDLAACVAGPSRMAA